MDTGSVPEGVWQTAKERAALLRPLAARDEAPAHLVRAAAHDLNISERWAYRLIGRLRERNGELASLLPRTGRGAPDRPRGAGQAAGRRTGRGAPDRPRIAGRGEAVITEVIETIYLKRQKVRPSEVVREVKARCAKANIASPSEPTIRRRLAKIARHEVARHREPQPESRPIEGSTPVPEFPLNVVQVDHTPVDVILVDPVERLPIGRPYLTLAIDVMSRAIAGFYLSLDPPSATSVGLCLTHVAVEKEPWMLARGVEGAAWQIVGKPQKVGVDNGSEFHSQAFERGCAQHGIEIEWRPPGQPQFGGVIERVIGTLMRRVHRLPGTTFSNTAQRGDYDSDGRACLTLEELERWLTVAICKDYHRSGHRGLDGAPPLARLEEGLRALADEGGTPTAPRDPRSYLIDFLPVMRRTLRRDGFVVDHIRYFSNALKPWITSRDARVEGPFALRRDPRDLSRIYVLDPFDGSWLEVPYRTLSRPTITLWEHRAGLRRLRERSAAQVDEAAIFAALDEMRTIERDAKRSTRSVRRRRSRPSSEQWEAVPRRVGVKATPNETQRPEPFSDIEEW